MWLQLRISGLLIFGYLDLGLVGPKLDIKEIEIEKNRIRPKT
jgi:hypothetical protein